MGLDQWLRSNQRDEVIYWRKANQIHGFFERKFGEIKNQRNHPVKLSDLEQLLDTCIRVKDHLIAGGTKLEERLVEQGVNDNGPYEKKEYVPIYINKNKALELLPPTPGFFFGSYEIDQWYLEDIEETIEKLAEVLSTKQKGERFYYRAWW